MHQPSEDRLRRIAFVLLAVLAALAVVLLFISDNKVLPIVLLVGAALGAARVRSEAHRESSDRNRRR